MGDIVEATLYIEGARGGVPAGTANRIDFAHRQILLEGSQPDGQRQGPQGELWLRGGLGQGTESGPRQEREDAFPRIVVIPIGRTGGTWLWTGGGRRTPWEKGSNQASARRGDDPSQLHTCLFRALRRKISLSNFLSGRCFI